MSSSWLALSLLFHGIGFATLYFEVSPSKFETMDNEVYEVTLKTMDPSGSTEVQPVFDENSDIVMNIPKERKKKKDQQSLAERLLKKYSKVKVPSSQTLSAPEEPSSLWKSRIRPKVAHGSLGDQLKNLPDKKEPDLKMNNQGFSKDKMSQHLATYQKQFQRCYESALLKDSSLNGKIQFDLLTAKSGDISKSQIDFEGVGRPSTRADLIGCLRTVVRKIQFPQTLASTFGKNIRFQAVLSL